MRSRAAIFLLLSIVLDLGFAVSCDDDAFAFQTQQSQSAGYSRQDPSQQQDDGGLGHECFCCCRHIRQEESLDTSVHLHASIRGSDAYGLATDTAPVPLYHPPQSNS